MMENATKAKLAAGEAVYGCFVRYPEPTLAEVVALQGWDFLVFDGEHGPLHPGDIEGLCRAAELRGATPIARVTSNDAPAILRFLDAGAHGVHVPWVNTAAEVEAAVQAVKYGPRGRRGLAGSRAGGWGFDEPLADFTTRSNRETMVIIHIETAAAADAAADYAAVDGVDVLFIGPTDLSHSLGHPGNSGHPEVQEVMEQVAAVTADSDKTLGIYAATPETVAEWAERGARYFTTGIEGFLKNGMRDYLSRVRGG